MLLNKLRLVLVGLIASVSFLFCMDFESDKFIQDSTKNNIIDTQIALVLR